MSKSLSVVAIKLLLLTKRDKNKSDTRARPMIQVIELVCCRSGFD